MWKFLILFIFVLTSHAETVQTTVQQPAQPPITIPQNIAFENCTKILQGSRLILTVENVRKY